MTKFASYDEFFHKATGKHPYPYQLRIAESGRLPDVIDVPPALGKTAAIVLGWLWLVHNGNENTPRRLVLAMPMRTLTRQAVKDVEEWLGKLGWEHVDVQQLVGGVKDRGRTWRRRPHDLQIIIGTVDMVISRMLMRGYGLSRGVYPVDAGILWNDTHLVVDETQLAPASTVTARQISAFQRRYGTVAAVGLTCMSATINRDMLDTVDNPLAPESRIIELSPDDETPEVTLRLDAKRTIGELSLNKPDNPKAVADAVVAQHRLGLTLVIVNTVDMAVNIYKKVSGRRNELGDPDVILLHSRFRPIDRDGQLDKIGKQKNLVVISTQVVEAGVDIDARTLITEAAPWSSLVQRSGRCNRAGLTDDVALWWFPSGKKHPYEQSDVEATADKLRELEGQRLSNRQLLELGHQVTSSETQIRTLRRSDFLLLFDTSPDLSGNDCDISPYIRDTDHFDVQLAWADIGGRRPDDDFTPPGYDYRCRATVKDLRGLLERDVNLWFYNTRRSPWGEPRWTALRSARDARPGQVFVLDAASGGYSSDFGLDVTSQVRVILHEEQGSEKEAGTQKESGGNKNSDSDPEPPGGGKPTGDGDNSDAGSTGYSGWLPLTQHLKETKAAAETIVNSLALNDVLREDVVLAAYLHDIGKAHPTWQQAISRLGTLPSDLRGPLAKSPENGRLVYGDGIRSFRHEFASVAMLDSAYTDLIQGAHDRDLVRYLIAAHHGKVRMWIRNPRQNTDNNLLGVTKGSIDFPVLLDIAPRSANIDPYVIRRGTGNDDGWTDMVDRLIETYGVFRLAYLEALVRIADWNASALHDGEK